MTAPTPSEPVAKLIAERDARRQREARGNLHCVNCDASVRRERDLYCRACEQDPRRLPAHRTLNGHTLDGARAVDSERDGPAPWIGGEQP